MVDSAAAAVVVARAPLPIVVKHLRRYHDGTASFFVAPDVKGEPAWL